MAKQELFQSKISRYFLRRLGAFPVHRGKLDRKALRQTEQLLASGLPLIMFPEGTRSKNARLQTTFPGSALIATRNRVPVLPVGITGSERIKGIFWIIRRPRIKVNFGSPFYLSSDNKVTKDKIAVHSNLIREHIAGLLPKEYGGSIQGKVVR